MQLTLTSNSILNTGFATDDGAVLFASESSGGLLRPVTVIKRFHPDRYDWEEIAEISWKVIRSSSQIKFKDGRALSGPEFLPKRDRKYHRKFVASDDREYIWKYSVRSELFFPKPDGGEHRVASFSGGGISKYPTLTIDPAYEQILDSILTSFVFVEKLKRSR